MRRRARPGTLRARLTCALLRHRPYRSGVLRQHPETGEWRPAIHCRRCGHELPEHRAGRPTVAR